MRGEISTIRGSTQRGPNSLQDHVLSVTVHGQQSLPTKLAGIGGQVYAAWLSKTNCLLPASLVTDVKV